MEFLKNAIIIHDTENSMRDAYRQFVLLCWGSRHSLGCDSPNKLEFRCVFRLDFTVIYPRSAKKSNTIWVSFQRWPNSLILKLKFLDRRDLPCVDFKYPV